MTDLPPLRGHNLVAALHATAAAGGWLDQRAFTADGETIRHSEVYARAAAAAAVLAAHGVQAGDHVLLALNDGVDFAAAFLGAIHLGAVAVLANPHLHTAELRDVEQIAAPTLVVTEPHQTGTFSTTAVLPAPRFSHALAAAAPAPMARCAPQTPAYGQFTSGTTGRPKLILHRHADPLVFDQAFGAPVLGLHRHDVVFSVSRTYFAYGLGNSLFYPLLHGATAILTPARPSAEDALRAVNDHGVTVLFAVPTFYAHLLAHPDHTITTALRLAVTAGEVLPPGLEERMVTLIGRRLLNGIGSTEVGQTFASNTPHAWRATTVGRALPPYAVRVVTNDHTPAEPGTEGHLHVRGPTIGTGPNPGLTDAQPGNGGWYPTGDLAILDTDGYLRPTGRADDVENVGGINVHPGDIESVLSEHPLVCEVAVCAPRSVQEPSGLYAYVVRKRAPTGNAQPDNAQLTDQLLAMARHRLTGYKVPKSVVFVSALPRTNSGKLHRHELRTMAAAAPPGKRVMTP